jgi:hypothetical protein
MSSFRVQLDDSGGQAYGSKPAFDGSSQPRQKKPRTFMIVAVTVSTVVLVALAAGFLYYQSLKKTPQYSLALLVDAAKRDDKTEIDELVDINAVVDDFMPQVTDKAVALYGRGLPPQTIQRVAALAQPLLPAVKDRARAELPSAIRSRSEKYGSVPFFMMVFGADRYFDISVTGDTAIAKSKNADRPLEMKIRRNGGKWQITGLKDDQLATDMARKIGQEIIAIAMNGGKNTADKSGIGNLSDVLRQAEELIK